MDEATKKEIARYANEQRREHHEFVKNMLHNNLRSLQEMIDDPVLCKGHDLSTVLLGYERQLCLYQKYATKEEYDVMNKWIKKYYQEHNGL